VPIGEGSIFGEVGLISGRPRGSTVRAAEPTVCVELSRRAALKLLATAPGAAPRGDAHLDRAQLLQIFGSGLTSADVAGLVERGQVEDVSAGKAVICRGRRRQGHLRRAPRVDDRREGDRRQAGVPLVPPAARTSARWR
jgi:hypothetical protein